jgi:hypothetical protein
MTIKVSNSFSSRAYSWSCLYLMRKITSVVTYCIEKSFINTFGKIMNGKWE